MTIEEATRICRQFYALGNPGEDDRFLFTEAMQYLIEQTHDPRYMMALGGMYYENKDFDLALKYYEMAAEEDELKAFTCLGYIWYYGRTGQRDFEKAFHYYDKARMMGDMIAAYKVADMYRNGYYVQKDPAKSKAILEKLYPRIRKTRNPFDPLPEISTRLARVRTEEGRPEEALQLYLQARKMMVLRLAQHPFFGDVTIMKGLVCDLSRLKPFDAADFDLYDLFDLMRSPAKVRFTYESTVCEVEAVPGETEPAIRFGEKWFRTLQDFMLKAEIDGELLITLYDDLYDYTLVEGPSAADRAPFPPQAGDSNE